MKREIDLRGLFYRQIFKYRRNFNIKVINPLVRLKLFTHGVELGVNTRFLGFPMISREPNSVIAFGNNCEFNSSRHSVKIGLFRPCSFATIRKGARIVFGDNVGGTGSTIVAALSVTIGNHVMIGANCTIIDTDFHNTDPSERITENIAAKPVVIEDNVFLGFNCFILKGVTIGKNAVIGANSVVISNIPPNSIAMGNPCKVIIQRSWSPSENS